MAAKEPVDTKDPVDTKAVIFAVCATLFIIAVGIASVHSAIR